MDQQSMKMKKNGQTEELNKGLGDIFRKLLGKKKPEVTSEDVGLTNLSGKKVASSEDMPLRTVDEVIKDDIVPEDATPAQRKAILEGHWNIGIGEAAQEIIRHQLASLSEEHLNTYGKAVLTDNQKYILQNQNRERKQIIDMLKKRFPLGSAYSKDDYKELIKKELESGKLKIPLISIVQRLVRQEHKVDLPSGVGYADVRTRGPELAAQVSDALTAMNAGQGAPAVPAGQAGQALAPAVPAEPYNRTYVTSLLRKLANNGLLTADEQKIVADAEAHPEFAKIFSDINKTIQDERAASLPVAQATTPSVAQATTPSVAQATTPSVAQATTPSVAQAITPPEPKSVPPQYARTYLFRLCSKLWNHELFNREPLTLEEQKDYDAANQHPVTQSEITEINRALNAGHGTEFNSERLTPEEEKLFEDMHGKQPTVGSRIGTYPRVYTDSLLRKVARGETITDEERQILIDEGLGPNMRSLELSQKRTPRPSGFAPPSAPPSVPPSAPPSVAQSPVNTEGVFKRSVNAPEGGIPEQWMELMELTLANISAKNKPEFAPIIEKMNDVIYQAKNGDAKTVAKALLELKRLPAYFHETVSRDMEIDAFERTNPQKEKGKQHNDFLNFVTGADLLIYHNWGKKLEYGTYMHGPVPYSLIDIRGVLPKEHFELGERESSPASASAPAPAASAPVSPPPVASTQLSEEESPDAMTLKFTNPLIGKNVTTRMILNSPGEENLNHTIKKFMTSIIDPNREVIGHAHHIKSILIRKNTAESPPTAGVTVTHDVSILPRTIHGRMLTSGEHELDLSENPD